MKRICQRSAAVYGVLLSHCSFLTELKVTELLWFSTDCDLALLQRGRTSAKLAFGGWATTVLFFPFGGGNPNHPHHGWGLRGWGTKEVPPVLSSASVDNTIVRLFVLDSAEQILPLRISLSKNIRSYTAPLVCLPSWSNLQILYSP